MEGNWNGLLQQLARKSGTQRERAEALPRGMFHNSEHVQLSSKVRAHY